MLRHHC